MLSLADRSAPRGWLPGPLVVLALASVVVVAVQATGEHHTGLHYFLDAARALLDGGDTGGLRLYDGRPELQFGPPAVLLAVPVEAAGDTVGPWLLTALLAAGGLVVALHLGRRLYGVASLGAGLLVIVTWGDLSIRTAHLDDAVALVALVAGVALLGRRRPWWAAAVLGTGAAAKPWALGFVLVAAAAPGRNRWWRPVAGAAVAAGWWAPFLAASGATWSAARHGIDVKPESVLALAGLAGDTTPGWCRPAQLAGGVLLAAWATAAGRWAAAPLAVVSFRLLLDPDVNRYYTVGFVVAALLFEGVHRPRRWPVLAFVGAAVLETSEVGPWSPTTAAVLRAGLLAAALACALAAGASPDPGVQEPTPARSVSAATRRRMRLVSATAGTIR